MPRRSDRSLTTRRSKGSMPCVASLGPALDADKFEPDGSSRIRGRTSPSPSQGGRCTHFSRGLRGHLPFWSRDGGRMSSQQDGSVRRSQRRGSPSSDASERRVFCHALVSGAFEVRSSRRSTSHPTRGGTPCTTVDVLGHVDGTLQQVSRPRTKSNGDQLERAFPPSTCAMMIEQMFSSIRVCHIGHPRTVDP